MRILREAVGEEVELMFDAYNGWDLTYALEWARQVEQYRPHWIEEAFHPEKVESFVALRRSIGFPVASGEHLYGRWEAEEYLKAGALNVLQADPEWCGGVSELVKMCTVASLHDVHVIPHGHSIHAALHVVASQSPMTCPLVEYLVIKMGIVLPFRKEAAAAGQGEDRAAGAAGIRDRARPSQGGEAEPGVRSKPMAFESDKVMFEIYRETGYAGRYRVVYFTELQDHNKETEINRALAGEHFYDGFLANYGKEDAKQIIEGLLARLNSGETIEPAEVERALAGHMA